MPRQKSLRELEQIQQNLEYQNDNLRVFIADILPKEIKDKKNMQDRMIELENLVNTFGGTVILKHIQNKNLPDYNTFLWEGRLDEIIEEMQEQKANLLILWNILKAHQIYKINEKLKPIWAKAWDRVDLILKIFEKNAKTKEAKLQIELASIKHMWPRIFGMWMELSKQWAWVWTRWKWETNTEIMKRHLAKREQAIKKELAHFEKVRATHRQSRRRKWIKTVGIVGYTNAWKSTLTNVLTKKWVLQEDKLFATLGTSVGKMICNYYFDPETGKYSPPKEILINDTIWFIRELPPKLIDAFKSTLEDSIEADLLLHVIDARDDKIEEKIEVVDKILDEIWANQKKLYVFNKIDGLSDEEFVVKEEKIIDWEKTIEEKKYKNKLEYLKQKYASKNPIFISAGEKIGIEKLKEKISKEV